jgi:hypothetical protein
MAFGPEPGLVLEVPLEAVLAHCHLKRRLVFDLVKLEKNPDLVARGKDQNFRDIGQILFSIAGEHPSSF